MFEEEKRRIKKRLGLEIKRVRKRMGITQIDLSNLMKVSQPYISKIEKGETLPGKQTRLKIARSLKLQDDYFERFLEKEESPQEQNQKEILNLLKGIVGEVNKKHEHARPIPIREFWSGETVAVKEIEMPVGAGECFTNDNVVDEHVIPAIIANGASFMLKVKGTSMEPFIYDGELILVVPQNFVERDGQLAVVNVENTFNSVKFVYVKEHLVGLGRSRETARWYPSEEVRVQGIVVNRISSYNVIRDMENRARKN